LVEQMMDNISEQSSVSDSIQVTFVEIKDIKLTKKSRSAPTFRGKNSQFINL